MSIIEGCFPNNDVMDNMVTSFIAGSQFPFKFDKVIFMTSLYEGIVVYQLEIALWEGVTVLKGLRLRMAPLHISRRIPVISQYGCQLQFDSLGCRKLPFFNSGVSFSLNLIQWSQDSSLQRYGGVDPKIINNTCNTEEKCTSSCTQIEWNPHIVMTIYLPGFDSWGKIAIFSIWGGWFPSKIWYSDS